MADITMCANGDKCPRHPLCYRWTAPRSEFWQAFAAFYKPDQECNEFWDNTGWHRQPPEPDKSPLKRRHSKPEA